MRRAILALAMLGAASLSCPASAQAPAPGLLRILGRATVERAPDYASVRVGVDTRGGTAAAALADNTAASRRVIDLAKAAGLEERDITTSAVMLQPALKQIREAGGPAMVPDGYKAGNTVTLRVRDLSRTGDLIRRVVESGVNRIDGLVFGLNDPARALEDAQADAVADAVRRAGRIAGASGVSLGSIDRIDAPPRSEAINPALTVMADLPVPRRAAGGPVPVEAGTVEVSAEVDVVFRLLQP